MEREKVSQIYTESGHAVVVVTVIIGIIQYILDPTLNILPSLITPVFIVSQLYSQETRLTAIFVLFFVLFNFGYTALFIAETGRISTEMPEGMLIHYIVLPLFVLGLQGFLLFVGVRVTLASASLPWIKGWE